MSLFACRPGPLRQPPAAGRRSPPPARSRPYRPRLELLEERAPASVLYGLTATNQLVRFDSAAPGTIQNTAVVTGLQTGESLLGIDFRPATGQLYGLGSTGTVYTLHPLTGAATPVGAGGLALTGTSFGFDFNPVPDRIRVVSDADQNLRLNPNTGGLAGTDTNLAYATGDANAGADPNVVGAAYDRNYSGTAATTLYGIDSNLDVLVRQGSVNGTPTSPNTGQLTTVGALGVNTTDQVGFDIAAGGGTAFAALQVGGVSGLYTINLNTGVATLVGAIGSGTPAITGLAVVPDDIQVTGADAGGAPHVRVFDAFTGAEKFSFFAYDASFTGGVRVATGDVNRDGTPDIITAAGPTGGPHVRVFDGTTGQQLAGAVGNFFAYDPSFVGGVFVASGDVNRDGFDDIITGADAGGGPHVKVFSGQTGDLLLSFFAYDPGFPNGVRVAAADFDLDGDAEIITAAGLGGGPHVRVFDGTTGQQVAGPLGSFFAYAPSFTGGVFVSAGDVNGDGIPDILTGAGNGGGPHVEAFDGATGALIASFFAFDPTFTGGVRVGVADVNADGRLDILASQGFGSTPQVNAFDGVTQAQVDSFFAYATQFAGGVFAQGARF
jgi:hypothetical protein